MGTRPAAGLEAHHAAPGGRQADGAADVGAQVQRPIACGRRRGGPGAAAAGVLAQVPGVAREPALQRMKAAQARRQHAVVGHRGLAQQHRAGLAQARGRRGVGAAGFSSVAAVPSGRARPRVAMFSFSVAGTPSSALSGWLALPARLLSRAPAPARVGIQRPGGVQVRFPALDVRQHVAASPPPATARLPEACTSSWRSARAGRSCGRGGIRPCPGSAQVLRGLRLHLLAEQRRPAQDQPGTPSAWRDQAQKSKRSRWRRIRPCLSNSNSASMRLTHQPAGGREAVVRVPVGAAVGDVARLQLPVGAALVARGGAQHAPHAADLACAP
jgi:hypothetical protein